jgi:hypothetical protein
VYKWLGLFVMKQSTNTHKYIIFDDDAIYSNQNRLLQIKISLYLMIVLCPIWKKLRSVTCFARYLFIVLHSLYTKRRNDHWLCNNSMLFVYNVCSYHSNYIRWDSDMIIFLYEQWNLLYVWKQPEKREISLSLPNDEIVGNTHS